MVVAELDAFFSRPVAPTRRIAMGDFRLPIDNGTAAASMLLGGSIAAFCRGLDAEDTQGLLGLIDEVEVGRRVPQPQLRHRFQSDRIGLKQSASRLVQDRGGFFHLDLDRDNGTAAQHALVAVYATRYLPSTMRPRVADALRLALSWTGQLGPELLAVLRGGAVCHAMGAAHTAVAESAWALRTLELAAAECRPGRSEVQRAFRSALRSVHPDHGAPLDGAARRIAELDRARRILLD